ncbi:phosphodiesterase [Endozoicomonas sp. OPT23]|uniref:phosphodiesterase n=1 Tax=Endozoicomonas sp. OPT23 TaxID=2072845 RepID=UPI00129A1BBD|nr:phosphodiesterase [Endozoicomonas sp. OPT23]MRI35249.1 phosphodiesterase [Endozoicomonas sp. OPT23]
MNFQLIKTVALLPFLLVTSVSAQDSIAVPVGSQSAELRSTILIPKWGESMQSVEDRLGVPQGSETIGKPAITSWVYADITVYFEGKTVLRTVVHHKKTESTGTSIARSSTEKASN